jgi:hypothetical protein
MTTNNKQQKIGSLYFRLIPGKLYSWNDVNSWSLLKEDGQGERTKECSVECGDILLFLKKDYMGYYIFLKDTNIICLSEFDCKCLVPCQN